MIVCNGTIQISTQTLKDRHCWLKHGLKYENPGLTARFEMQSRRFSAVPQQPQREETNMERSQVGDV
jgi:hypothetical protein